MKHIIIGTAGHIDHGKTTLIHALTGRNTDRLKEEQKRGITIELGFTWFDLKDQTRCGIIDVPGHEKFINNMVAGVVGMDLVLMVVAADEGIMPQTKEHLDILGLLGIEKTILVLNKCDTVDAEWLSMMEEDVKEELKGTIMEGAPVAKVSAMTGEGIDELKELIWKLVKDDVQEKDVNSIPRLPVDRVFSMPGFGTVVTGTLLSGSISKNDTLEVFPLGKECKIRNIQVHETNQDMCEAGQRVALNISNIHKDELHRGSVIAPIGSMENSRLMDVKLTVLKDSKRNIKNRDRLHLFTGTSEILCRAILLDKDELMPGETGLAELLLEEELATKRGDRFIVRFYSPLETIGGGMVLEPNPRKKKRFNEDAIEELLKKESGSLADVCELNIRAETEDLITLKELAKNMSHSAEELLPYLEELIKSGIVFEFPKNKDVFYWHRDNAFIVSQEITRDLKKFYDKYPYRMGIKKAEIHSTYMKKVKINVFEECIGKLVSENLIEVRNEYVCLSNYEVNKDETYLCIEKLLTDTFETAGYAFLRFSEIDKKKYSDEVVMDVLRVMIDEGKVVKVGIELEMYTMKHFMDVAEERIRDHFKTNEMITISEVREMFETSRKCAKPIIEYMDVIKVTKKVGAETERVAY
ncbi:MAG: selenocysteine-specific translation elongation factor [Catonella sp.]|uniref:selenocysteine-specific translation elongation factor n=1 Tax=Catonella sp. TaxID=2382125 RepID=UPI003FA060F4